MIYKPIPEFPAYRVGDNGTIWTKLVPHSRGRLGDSWREVRTYPSTQGYRRVILRQNSHQYWRGVHRLVLEAFVSPCPSGMMACHNNGIPSDNRLCNLRWDTMKANQDDRVAHGTSNRGEQHGCARLTAKDVMAIRARRERGERNSVLAREYGVDPSTISHIKRRKLWRHVV